ncbi:MAG: bifunctional UDP-N-acetylglucosamine diphosphorylase/glucosamine-1-phosphate N-acetyltransferase GlmU [Pseudomonadota bacterium]
MGQSSLQLEAVVLAAGKGTRMKSARPKVLHELAGKPMLHHVLEQASGLGAQATHVVIGNQAEQVRAATPHEVNWVLQTEQLGTGHAVQQAMPAVADDATVLVLYGDVPLASAALLKETVAVAATGVVALVTADFADPAQLGRIIRTDGAITEIVEYKDASERQKAIHEINSGILALPAKLLRGYLQEIERAGPQNKQGEYYLTDVIALAVRDGIAVHGIKAPQPQQVMGVNDRVQLAELERYYQHSLAEALMRDGVTLADPARFDLRGELTVGQDVQIDINAVIEGTVTLCDGVRIGPNCVIRDSVLERGARVEANSTVDGAQIGADASVGPFARIRPGTVLGERVKVGNFVETKKTRIGNDSKASHLTYLGDATLGTDCNVGAGTVTCNYDGINKHPTTIGDRVFVGTNSTLVAPLDLGDDAFVAAGSTITKSLENEELGVGRGRQKNIKGWTRPDRRDS